MNPEVRTASVPEDSANRLSRRVLLGGMLATPGLRALEKHHWDDSLAEYQKDFHLVSDARRVELLGHGSYELTDQRDATPGTSDEEILNLTFTKNADQLVLLHFQGIPDKHISAPVIFADIGDRTHHVTLLQTPHTAEQMIAVHTAEEGENTVRIRRTEASENLDFGNLFVTARSAEGFSPIYQATLAVMGEIGWRGDNAYNYYRSDSSPELRKRALTNDSAFFSEIDVLEHDYDRNLIMVQVNRGARSESPRSPENLYGEAKRLYDYDPVVLITMDRQGNIYGIAYQTDTNRSHQVKTIVRFSSPMSYDSPELQRFCRFYEIQNRQLPGTGHGMIAPGVEKITVDGVEYDINTVWSIVPRARQLRNLSDRHILPLDREIEIARQTIAVRANLDNVTYATSGESLKGRTEFLQGIEDNLTTKLGVLLTSAFESNINEIPIFS